MTHGQYLRAQLCIFRILAFYTAGMLIAALILLAIHIGTILYFKIAGDEPYRWRRESGPKASARNSAIKAEKDYLNSPVPAKQVPVLLLQLPDI